jgi:hypothetical protein
MTSLKRMPPGRVMGSLIGFLALSSTMLPSSCTPHHVTGVTCGANAARYGSS